MMFSPEMEAEFRRWYLCQIKSRVRTMMWWSAIALLSFWLMPSSFWELGFTSIDERRHLVVDVLRFGVLLPSALVMLAITYTPLYTRWYLTAVQIVAPLNIIAFITMDILVRPRGISLTAWIMLGTLACYFMYGMTARASLRSAALALTAYIVLGLSTGIDSVQWRLDLSAIAFAACLGGLVYRTQHRALRADYFNYRVLSESINRDALTGVCNRRMFDEQIDRLWRLALREGTNLGLLFVDIDHFKRYNDSRGHQAGDECLARIAAILSDGSGRPLDLTARYGGEEFAVLLYDAERRMLDELAEQLCARVIKADIPHPASPVHPSVTVSIGGAWVTPREDRSYYGLVQLADEALYAAKRRGRNRIVVMDKEYHTLKTGVFRSFEPEAIA